MNSPKNLILLPKEFKISGQARVDGQWNSFEPFFIERFDDSFLTCGIRAFVPEGADALEIQVSKCYLNNKHHALCEIKIQELVLTLCDEYENNER